jgi:hypothetical protein
MSNVVTMPRSARIRLDQILECAVILNWDDVAVPGPSTLIHVEYERSAQRPLARVKVWTSSMRGVWTLICEYRSHAQGDILPGVSFGRNFVSHGLATMLDTVIRNQSLCAAPPDNFRSGSGLVQVSAPSPEQRTAAAVMMRDFSTPRLAEA